MPDLEPIKINLNFIDENLSEINLDENPFQNKFQI